MSYVQNIILINPTNIFFAKYPYGLSDRKNIFKIKIIYYFIHSRHSIDNQQNL